MGGGKLSITLVAVCAVVFVAGCSGLPDTDTDTETGGTVVSPEAYTGDVDTAAIRRAHNASLREAGSYTVSINQTFVRSDLGPYSTIQTKRANLDRRTVLSVTREAPGGNRSTYRSPNQSAVTRVDRGEYGGVSYRDADIVPALLPTLGGTVIDVLESGSLDHETLTRDGDTLHRYTAAGTGNLSSVLFEESANVTVDAFSFELTVQQNGPATGFSYDVSFVRDGQPTRVVLTQRLTDVGSTTVGRPDWLSEARATVASQQRSQSGPQTYTATSDAQQMNLSVQVPRSAVGAEPRIRDAPSVYDNEGLAAARVGGIAQLYWPEETRIVRVTATYDPAEMPAGYTEANVTLARFDPAQQLFLPVESVTVDEQRNRIAGPLDPAYSGQTFAVLNYQRYLALFETDGGG
jgi:hypothetical protein